MLKRLLSLPLLVSLVLGSMPACSVVDPSDEDQVLAAIDALPPEAKTKLAAEARKIDACRLMRAIMIGRTWTAAEEPHFQCLGESSGDSLEIKIFAEQAYRFCMQWDGTGSMRSAMSTAVRDHINAIDGSNRFSHCEPFGSVSTAIEEAEADYPDPASADRTAELLLVGAIAAVVLVAIAPELLPVLCALDVSTYCGDSTPTPSPTPLPAPTNPPAPDAP